MGYSQTGKLGAPWKKLQVMCSNPFLGGCFQGDNTGKKNLEVQSELPYDYVSKTSVLAPAKAPSTEQTHACLLGLGRTRFRLRWSRTPRGWKTHPIHCTRLPHTLWARQQREQHCLHLFLNVFLHLKTLQAVINLVAFILKCN